MNANLTAQAETSAADTTASPALVVVELQDGKRPCGCSDNCPQLTGRYFAQGHDARMVTRLRNAVMAEEMTINDAFAEVIKRGGTDRLQIKLDAAVANARKPRKAKGKKAARVIDTFELGEFCLASMPLASEPRVVAKVGRWEYRGEILTYQIIEDGKVSKGDTVLVFEYANKAGERQQTLTYTKLRTDEEFDSVALDVVAEPDTEVPFNAFANRVATPAPAPEVPAEDTSDIPF